MKEKRWEKIRYMNTSPYIPVRFFVEINDSKKDEKFYFLFYTDHQFNYCGLQLLANLGVRLPEAVTVWQYARNASLSLEVFMIT